MSMSRSISTCTAPTPASVPVVPFTAPPASEVPSRVAVLRWPADAAVRTVLRAAALPRVLLVAPGLPGPFDADRWEDWVDAGSPPAELDLRRRTLAQLATHSTAAALGAAFDVADHLSKPQQAMLEVAARRRDRPVHRHALVAAFASHARGSHARFASELRGLRLAIGTIGLELVSLGHREYVLTTSHRALHMPFTSDEHR